MEGVSMRGMACLGVQLRLVPGRKGLRTALGDVPSWVAFQDKEKVEVSAPDSAFWLL